MPTTYANKGATVGLEHVQFWLTDSQGYCMGTAGDGAANGTTSHAVHLPYGRSAGLPTPARVLANLTGGNRWLGTVQFGISELGEITLTTQDLDTVAFTMATGSSEDTTTNARWVRFSDNVNRSVLPQLGVMLTTIHQSLDEDTDGTQFYINYIFPRAQLNPVMAPMNYQAEGQVTYNIRPTLASREPTGRLFSAGAMGLAGNRAAMYAIVTPKPLSLTTYISDGTETDIVLGFKPTSTQVTLNDAANEFAREGTLQALSSVTLATAVAVMAAAGTAGNRNVCMYETDFEAVA